MARDEVLRIHHLGHAAGAFDRIHSLPECPLTNTRFDECNPLRFGFDA